MVRFDEGTEWAGGMLFFWVHRGDERIRCVAGREAIARLPGYAMATNRDISAGRSAIKELLKPYVLEKLASDELDVGAVPTITISMRDLLAAAR
jgi:hypothetical protein